MWDSNNTIDSRVDERTLRELYLVPSEYAVLEGGTWGVMSAYNRLNGTFCSENEWLLTQVLRDEWGFDGFVASDWFAARSTAGSARAGLSLEMPGPGQWFNRGPIGEALRAGEMDEGHLDRIAGDVLRRLERAGALKGSDDCEPGQENELDRPEDRALIRQAAAAGTVLVSNNGVLPLESSMSATLAAPMLKGKLPLGYLNGHDWSGPVVHTRESASAEMVFFGEPGPGVNPEAFSVRASGVLVVEATGEHTVGLVQFQRQPRPPLRGPA